MIDFQSQNRSGTQSLLPTFKSELRSALSSEAGSEAATDPADCKQGACCHPHVGPGRCAGHGRNERMRSLETGSTAVTPSRVAEHGAHAAATVAAAEEHGPVLVLPMTMCWCCVNICMCITWTAPDADSHAPRRLEVVRMTPSCACTRLSSVTAGCSMVELSCCTHLPTGGCQRPAL